MKLGMIDYGRGNLRSVINACKVLGEEPLLITKPEQLTDRTHLIFPGQGAFGDCMDSLNRLGLSGPLKEWILADKPYFGICVGFQLLFESSEEAPGTEGLAIIPGQVTRFTSKGVKIPHMGWNAVDPSDPTSPRWSGLTKNPYFYFVHSYYPSGVPDEFVAGRCQYGDEYFCAAIEKGSLFATQFHPEKSQHAGLALLGNFLKAQPQPALP